MSHGATIPVDFGPSDLTITPDGMRIYVVNTGGTVSIIDTATNTVSGAIPVGVNFQSITITPDGTRAYVLNFGESKIAVIDTTSNTVVDTITSLSCPRNQGQCVSDVGRQRRGAH